ncbi:g1938 [Coccomyxa viridis]|uniref:G1938 protein n=1 Tax=Coccomyxa viridis TaxID=1274662 RepID=A0ABP1FM40_9CHLO
MRNTPARSSAGKNEFGGPRRRGTDVLMAINVTVFALQFLTKDKLLLWGAKDNQLIRAGQWWRLITPVALHANLLHLVTNNYSLNSLGPAVEMLSGRQRFLSVYAASAVAGSAASFAFSPAASVGASGAIFGLGGALAVYCARHRELMGSQSDAILRSLGQSLALNIAIGFSTPQIDQWGHFGGLLGGALTAYLLGPRLERVKRKGGHSLQDNPPIPLFTSKL